MSIFNKSRGVGIVLSYVNTFLNMICGLFLSAFLLRALGDVEYGIYQTVASFANYLVLLEFGVGTVLVRNLSVCRTKNGDKEEVEKNLSTLWIINNVLSVTILAVSVAFYFFIPTIYKNSLTAEQIVYGKKIFIVVTLYLVFSFYAQTLEKIPLAFEQYSYIAVVSIIKTLTRTAMLVGLICAFKYAILIAVVDAVISLCIAIFTYIYSRREFKIKINFKNFNKKIFKAALPLCLAIFLQAIVNQANNNVGKFIIGVKLSPEKVSLYSVGLYVYSIFSSVTTIPLSLYAPQVTKNVTQGLEGKALTDTLIPPSRMTALIGGALFFGFLAIGKQFVEIVYGADYLQAWFIAVILMFPMYINMTNGVMINVLDAMNKRMSRSVVLMVTTAINIFLTIFWIDRFGVIGAAAATAVCTFLGPVLAMNIYYSKVIGIKVFHMFYNAYKGILAYQILGALVGYLLGALVANVYFSFLVGGVVFVLIAFGGYFLFGKSEEEKKLFLACLNRFKRKKAEKNITINKYKD